MDNIRHISINLGLTNIGTIFLALLFVILWSSGWIGSKYTLDYMGTFTLLMWRYLFVVATLVVLVSLFRSWRRVHKSDLLSHILVGILSHAVYLSASLSAVDMGVSAGMTAFTLTLQPLLAAVISSPMTHEKVTLRQWLGLAIGLIAVVLVIGDRLSLGGSPFAYSLLLVSTMGITMATMIDRRMEVQHQKEQRPPIPMLLKLLIHCSAAAVVLIPLAGFFEGFQAQWRPEVFLSIAWLSWVVTLSAYGLFFVLLRRMSATKVSSLMYLSPPVTMLIAYVVFGEQLSNIDYLGLIIAGIAVVIVTSPGAKNEYTSYSPRNVREH